MHSFVVRVSCKLIFFVLIVKVCYIVIADTGGLVVLPTEKNTSLGKVNQRNHLRLLLHKLILGELVIGNQVTKLVLQVLYFLALTAGTI